MAVTANPTQPVRRLNTEHDYTFGFGFNNIATLAEAAAQRLECRLLLILGEWFLDTTAGVPWVQPDDGSSDVVPIMGANGPRNLPYAESVIKTAILGTNGIATLNSFSMTFDTTTRKLSIEAAGDSVDGDTWDIKVTTP